MTDTYDKSDLMNATMSFLEETKQVEGFVQVDIGRISKSSKLYEMLLATAKKVLGKEVISDDEIEDTFLCLDASVENSGTVSASEKYIPKQYQSSDYFESATVNFDNLYIRMRQKYLGNTSPESDISEPYSKYLHNIHRYKVAYINMIETKLRLRISQRAEKDGMTPLFNRR